MSNSSELQLALQLLLLNMYFQFFNYFDLCLNFRNFSESFMIFSFRSITDNKWSAIWSRKSENSSQKLKLFRTITWSRWNVRKCESIIKNNFFSMPQMSKSIFQKLESFLYTKLTNYFQTHETFRFLSKLSKTTNYFWSFETIIYFSWFSKAI
jgi:hypothetical protein